MFVNGPCVYLLPNNQFPIATKEINKLMLDILPLVKSRPILLEVSAEDILLLTFLRDGEELHSSAQV